MFLSSSLEKFLMRVESLISEIPRVHFLAKMRFCSHRLYLCLKTCYRKTFAVKFYLLAHLLVIAPAYSQPKSSRGAQNSLKGALNSHLQHEV